MWLGRGGPPETPLVLYEYQETRRAQHAKEFLKGYSGYLQTDGYSGYDSALKDTPEIIHVGCMAHARRKFIEAGKASKKAGRAEIAITMIREIYRAENILREKNLPEAKFLTLRKAEINPLLEKFKTWLDEKSIQVRPSSLTGQAIAYTLGQWHKLIRFVDSPFLTPDNNATERSIKPFIVGRKNWLFAGSPHGAKASCLFFSLIETAKANNINPYGYLKKIFDQVAINGTEVNPESFLPWNLNKDLIMKMPIKGL